MKIFILISFIFMYCILQNERNLIIFISFHFNFQCSFFSSLCILKKFRIFIISIFILKKKSNKKLLPCISSLLFYQLFFTVLYFFNDIAQSSENDFKLFPFIITVECRWYEVKSLHHKDLESLEYVCLWIRMHALDSH